MHETNKLDCIFVCDADDQFLHYLVCPCLWSLANQFFGGEEAVTSSERMCLQAPSVVKLQRLAMVHAIYHTCKRDHTCVEGAWVASPFLIQGKALGVARDVSHIVRYRIQSENTDLFVSHSVVPR